MGSFTVDGLAVFLKLTERLSVMDLCRRFYAIISCESIQYQYMAPVVIETTQPNDLREHYIQDLGAIPFSHVDPFMLLIDGAAAKRLFSRFLEEE